MEGNLIDQTDFENIIEKLVILPAKPKFLVAVSGGADSLCLAFMLQNFSRKIGAELVAAIVDHKLRAESTNEAQYVVQLLAQHGIDSVILTRKNIPLHSAVQQQAREDRYDLLKNYAKSQNFPYLFIAHHLDDQFETLLQREALGENLVGNAGMSAKVVLRDAIILRPFLHYSKSQILNTIQTFTNTWVEDPSNQNDKYSRVRYRKKIQAMSDTEKQLLIEKHQQNVENRIELENSAIDFLHRGIFINKFGLLKINFILLNKYEDNAKVFILRKCLRFANGKNYEPKIAQVREFLQYCQGKDSLKFSLGNCLLKLKKGELIIYKNRNLANKIKVENSTAYWDNRFVFAGKHTENIFIDKINKVSYFAKIQDKAFKKHFEKYGLDGDFMWGLPDVFKNETPLNNPKYWQNFNYKAMQPIFMSFFSKEIC
ncbi:MAG: tRNA lysidine(34) synthetase TilS [Alphaproteobacteria bacterium]|nr:tRNA lysidine(34) synthetase TilS [Alphaproteobacteria bacterium]